MYKRIILSVMIIIIVAMFCDTIYAVYKRVNRDITISNNCNGHIQMTCGEKGCEDLCYPDPIKIEILQCNQITGTTN